MAVLRGHEDEVLDVVFDLSGRQLASASADTTAILWNLDNLNDIRQHKRLKGHGGEVGKVRQKESLAVCLCIPRNLQISDLCQILQYSY